MQEDIKKSVINSKIYRCVCESTIDKLIERETPKFKKKKDIEQSVRAKLHAWVTMFYENYDKVLKEFSETNNFNEMLQNLLKTHISTKERYDFLTEFYGDINAVIGSVKSVLDLGAGFNPLAYYLYSKNKAESYLAVDVESNGVNILNLCFKKLNLNAKAIVGDAVDYKTEQVFDVVFLFKLLPLLEQQKKGSSVDLINNIQTKFLCITYPTRSLSGKNVGMYAKYKSDIEKLILDCNLKLTFEKEYKNEVLFILEK